MRRRASGSATSYDLETNKDAAQLRGEDRPSRLDVLDEIAPGDGEDQTRPLRGGFPARSTIDAMSDVHSLDRSHHPGVQGQPVGERYRAIPHSAGVRDVLGTGTYRRVGPTPMTGDGGLRRCSQR